MAETVGSRSRKRFLVLFRIIEQDQELVKKIGKSNCKLFQKL